MRWNGILRIRSKKSGSYASAEAETTAGDGVAIARILHLHGYAAEIYMMGNPDHRTEETRRQLEIAGNYQVPLVNNLN